MSEVTRILSAIEQGDPHAAEQLLPLVYDELRKLAAAEAGPGEAGPDAPGDRPGPRGLPAAGGRRAGRSTGTAAATSSPPPPRPCAASWSRTPAASRPASTAAAGGASTSTQADRRPRRPPDDLLALDEALDRLAGAGPAGGRAGQAPLLRRPVRRARRPQALGISRATADRHWAYARAWLYAPAAGDAAEPRPENCPIFLRRFAAPFVAL